MSISIKGNIVTVTSSWLIRLAWGKRRVSSKAAPDTLAYPSQVSAHWRMWLSWVVERQLLNRRQAVVISKESKSGLLKRYSKELSDKKEEEAAEAIKVEMASKIERLQHERLIARSKKDFKRADAIRDEIEAAGFVVKDASLKTITTFENQVKGEKQ